MTLTPKREQELRCVPEFVRVFAEIDRLREEAATLREALDIALERLEFVGDWVTLDRIGRLIAPRKEPADS